MPSGTGRTVWVALLADLGVALAKVGAAVFTGSPAMASEASHSLADTANDLFLMTAQRRSSRHPDDQHPLGYGREAYFWALIAALGVFLAGAAFSLREGISGDVITFASLALNQLTGSSIYQGVAAVLIALLLIRVSLQLVRRNHDFLLGQPITPTDKERVQTFLLGYAGVTSVRQLIVTFIGPSQVWVIARLDIDDGLRGDQVKSLVGGIELALKLQSKDIFRGDVVPIGGPEASPQPTA
jgi:divalent metal cation (Fe/Co/Zn/Cd) transporter